MLVARITGSGLVASLLVLVVVWAAFVPPASGAPTHKRYEADISPHAVTGGVAQSFTATLTNQAGQQQLGSANITAPAGFSVTSVSAPSPRGTATLASNVVELRDLSIPPGGTASVTFTATAPCTAGSATWAIVAKQANDFSGTPGNDFVLSDTSDLSVVVTGGCAVGLRFLAQPAHAEKTTTISSVPFDPAGAPVAVEVIDAAGNRVTSSTASITVALGSPVPTAGAQLSGTTTRAAVAGVASFTDLSIDRHGMGYTLQASSSGLGTVTSHAFNVWDEVQPCAAGQGCTGSIGAQGSMQTNITGASSSDGFILLSLGLGTLSCGDSSNHAPLVTTVDTYNFEEMGDKVAQIIVDKEVDQLQANNGVAFYDVCFEGEAPFTDKSGATTMLGLLPDCTATPAAPCVLSRNKTKAGDVAISFLLPPNDPAFY